MNYYISAFKKYAVFTGRAHRREYWYFVLFSIIVSVILSVIDILTGTTDTFFQAGLLEGLYSLVVLVPSLAVGTRRLHDVNKSGWWLLLMLLPVVGWIWLIVLFAKIGDTGTNQYGSEVHNEIMTVEPVVEEV